MAVFAVILALALALAGAVLVTGRVPGIRATPSPSPVHGLHTVIVSVNRVVLAWQSPATGTAPDSFRVLRDGHQIGTVPASGAPGAGLRFTDAKAAPGEAYTYSVLAIGASGASGPADLKVTVPTPPVSAARLSGGYQITIRLTSEYGFVSLRSGSHSKETWFAHPVCHAGACDVRLSGSSPGGSWTMRLQRSGATYVGTTYESLTKCQLVPVTDTIEVTLHVQHARALNGDWVVSSFSGTMRDTAPGATAGMWSCPGAGFTATFNGT